MRSPVLKLALAGIVLLLTACGDGSGSAPAVSATASPASNSITSQASAVPQPVRVLREAAAGLSQEYAAFRASQVGKVSYALRVNLQTNTDSFTGAVDIAFDLAPGNVSPLTLDFDSGTISEVQVNGQPAPFTYSRWFLSLAPDTLQTGANVISVKYSRPYATDGAGLHHFSDPQDQREYLYTNFEPYDANRWFPHFDQPDLKAPLTLTVLAPSQWQVIANTRETTTQVQGEQTLWRFPATAPLASYVYAMHAGPFHQWQSSAGDIPLRLFARESMASYIVPENWFEPTQTSFRFFQDYFAVPYPFGKYDQVIVPDFNAGAMENVAAVTFSERYVSRGTPSTAQLRNLANVISHEMAHMWFGDLVTMQWWNGLWLNESFATYMAYLALDRASDFTNVWDAFYSGNKMSAYNADALVTTHPIELEVPGTSDAFSNFDGITYGKGASVLKQLPFLIGEENFRLGVSNYLQTHAYSNTTLDDFVGALAQASGMELSQWQQEWLYQSGTNTIAPAVTCADGAITSLALLQTPPRVNTADQILRTQRTRIGLYRYTDNQMVRSAALPLTYSGGRTEVPDAIGLPCPDLVLPNEDDLAYMKINLDERSRTTVDQHINTFTNPTTRLMLWQSLWDSVLDGTLGMAVFSDFVLNNLGAETDDNVLRHVTGLLRSTFSYYSRFGNQTEAKATLESFAYAQLQAAGAGSEAQKIWYSTLVSSTFTPQGLGYLRNLLDGAATLGGLEIDQDKRWDIVESLNRYLFEDYAARLAAEQLRDTSDQGNNMALAAEVIRPETATKARWLDLIINAPDTYKLATLRYVMASLFPPEQQALKEPLRNQMLAAVPRFNEQAPAELLGDYAGYMDAATCTAESVQALDAANQQFAGMQASVVKSYLIHHQNDARCVQLKNALN